MPRRHHTFIMPVKPGTALLVGVLLLAVLHTPVVPPVRGQGYEQDGWTNYDLNMRTGPGLDFSVVGLLPGSSGLLFEARNEDTSWLFGHTLDGQLRGWVYTPYLGFRDGFISAQLPVSGEIVAQQAPTGTMPDPVSATDSDALGLEVMNSVPVISSIPAHVHTIVARGRQLGNHPDVFVRVGDCNAHSPAYMTLFGVGQYSLGPYYHLQETIDFFRVSEDSYNGGSLAAQAGFTAQAVVNPALADPRLCQGASPLECEYDRMRPGVALIMLGLTDFYYLTPEQYEQGMQQIIEVSIERGVIPVLTTVPIGPDASPDDKRITFNAIVIQLSRTYQVPLINLWRATQPLPQGGMADDLHVSYSGTLTSRDWIALGGEENEYGFTLWNLVTLQMLDQLRVQVLS